MNTHLPDEPTDSAAARGLSCLAVVALSLALWGGCAALIVWLR